MRVAWFALAAVLLCAWLATPSFGCTTDGSPAGVVRAYAAALDHQDGDRAATYLAADFPTDGRDYLPVYARVIEKYGVDVLEEKIDPTNTQATVRARERADLVVGGEDFAELIFTLRWAEGRWHIAGIADVGPAPAAAAAPH
ncbi:MAG TPA: hypothetical protein VG389_15940 [Myxococcota bacterium]|nr:hypothetical protein [Myxococcota bacterium]